MMRCKMKRQGWSCSCSCANLRQCCCLIVLLSFTQLLQLKGVNKLVDLCFIWHGHEEDTVIPLLWHKWMALSKIAEALPWAVKLVGWLKLACSMAELSMLHCLKNASRYVSLFSKLPEFKPPFNAAACAVERCSRADELICYAAAMTAQHEFQRECTQCTHTCCSCTWVLSHVCKAWIMQGHIACNLRPVHLSSFACKHVQLLSKLWKQLSWAVYKL